MNRAAESGLIVKQPSSLEVGAQPDKNKYYSEVDGSNHPFFPGRDQSMQSDSYYTGIGGPNYSVIAPPSQSNPSEAKGKSRSRAIWILATIAVVCLIAALGAGIGAGLAAQHKSSSPSAPAVSSDANNAPVTVTETSTPPTTITQSDKTDTITPTPTTLSPSCPATNGSTYTATNKPLPTDSSQIPETSLAYEILCNTNTAEGGSVMDMQLVANVSTLDDCMDACALFNFQLRQEHFPAYACTGVSWGHGFNLDPRHICWLKSNVTLGSPNDTYRYPGYDGAVLLDT